VVLKIQLSMKHMVCKAVLLKVRVTFVCLHKIDTSITALFSACTNTCLFGLIFAVCVLIRIASVVMHVVS
jgi:hypothetical protein